MAKNPLTGIDDGQDNTGGGGDYGAAGTSSSSSTSSTTGSGTTTKPAATIWDTSNNSSKTESEGTDSSVSESWSTSSSYAGLPEWALSIIKTMVGGDSEQLSGYQSALTDLSNVGKYADQKAASLNKEYARSIQSPITKALNSATAGAIGKGTLNSSIYGKAVGNIADEAYQSGITQQEKSNQWAADTKIQNASDVVTAQKSYADTIKELLGLSEYSKSESASGSTSMSSGSNTSESESKGSTRQWSEGNKYQVND